MANIIPPSPYGGFSWYERVKAAFTGIPEYIWGSIIGVESQGNPQAIGDGGKSYGLFQLYTDGGLGDAYRQNPTALFEPSLNAQIAAASIRPHYEAGLKAGKTGWSLLEYVASRSGFPLMTGTLPNDYREKLTGEYAKYSPAGNPIGSGGSGTIGTPQKDGLGIFQTIAKMEAEKIDITNPAGATKRIALMILLVLLSLILVGVGLVSFVGVGSAAKIVLNTAGGGAAKTLAGGG